MVQIVPQVLATLNAIDPLLFEAEFTNTEASLHLESWCVEVHMLLVRGRLPAQKRVRQFAQKFGRPCTVHRYVQHGEDEYQSIIVKFPYQSAEKGR